MQEQRALAWAQAVRPVPVRYGPAHGADGDGQSSAAISAPPAAFHGPN